jgi:class 3 adenylate cyclase/predicted ATPase
MSAPDEKARELKAAIAGLEAQRSALGDSVVESAVTALRQQLAELETPLRLMATEEERKVVTILFADVSGFTALLEKLDPEEVRNLINACFERLVPIVKKYEGTLDKFIGDEIMALFGAPVAHENDPERALRAALEMMEAIAAFNCEYATALDIHIGVNTGHVIAGKIGARGRRDYSVIGDAVNLAARLEGASPNGQIYVGPSTYRQTTALFNFEILPPLKLQGKEKPVEVYRLIGLKKAPGATHGIEGLRAPLIGRQSELAEIQSAFRKLRNGVGSILAIVGEAGLGKSRLIADAFCSTDIPWAEGRALAYTEGMSYWMARDLLRTLLGTRTDASPDEIEQALRSSIEQTAPEKMNEIYPYLGRLLEVPLPAETEEQIKVVSAQALQTRILRAFQDYIRARAARGALTLFWEDLHWCDLSSFRVLETLIALTKEVPLLLLLAYRPDPDFVVQLQESARAANAENFRVLELLPLTRKESGALIQSLLKIENLPEKMRALILDRAEGNPFFLEELLRSLLDMGTVVIENGRAIATGAIEVMNVPETVEGVLAARIDRLDFEEKQTLQNASVIGRVFQQRVLERLYEDKVAMNGQLNDSLAELQRRGFIQQGKSSEEREYIFKHAITHEVAYHSLLIARRKQLHGRVGEAIEALFPDRLDELSPTLGYHFEKAEAREKAIRYLRQAAERAQATFANAEALAFHRSALRQVELLLAARPDESLRKTVAQIQESVGDIYHLINQQEEARAAYESAQRSAPQDDVVCSSRLCRRQAKAWIIEDEYKRALQCYDQAEKTLQGRASLGSEWHRESLQIQLDRMWLHYWRAETDAIAALAERIRPLVEQHATPLQRGNFLQGLVLMALRRNRYVANDETIANAQTSLAAIEESNVLTEIRTARFLLGFVYLWTGALEPAEEWLSDALKLTEKAGDIVLQSRCLTYLTVTQRRRGAVENTRRYAEQSLVSATAAKMTDYIGMAKGNLAWVHLRNGDVVTAFEQASQAVKNLRQMPLLWVALWPLIGVEMARQQISGAIRHVETLLTPSQMAVSADLESAMRASVNAWKGNDPNTAKIQLERVADLARAIGYL